MWACCNVTQEYGVKIEEGKKRRKSLYIQHNVYERRCVCDQRFSSNCYYLCDCEHRITNQLNHKSILYFIIIIIIGKTSNDIVDN